MRDLYLGDLLEGEVYETFDGRAIYIEKMHDNYCAVYECERDVMCNWVWNLRTINYLRKRIRTILEVC